MTDPEEVRNMRTAMRLTQAQLAWALGVRENTVYRWETGRNPVPPYLRLALIGLVVSRANNGVEVAGIGDRMDRTHHAE